MVCVEFLRHAYSMHQSQLPGREKRRTEGPKDGTKVTCNLGIAYVSQEIRRRRDHSTQMLIVTDETRGRVLERAGSIQRRLTRMSYKTLERLERLRRLN